eukprot:3358369-Alexandrium_andersonii.AAC.1
MHNILGCVQNWNVVVQEPASYSAPEAPEDGFVQLFALIPNLTTANLVLDVLEQVARWLRGGCEVVARWLR